MKYLSIHPVEIKPAKQIYIVYIEAIEIKKKHVCYYMAILNWSFMQ